MIKQEAFLLSLRDSYKDEYTLAIGALLGDLERQTSPILKALILTDIFKLCAGFWEHQKLTMPLMNAPMSSVTLPSSVYDTSPVQAVAGRQRSGNVKVVHQPTFHQATKSRSGAIKPVQAVQSSSATATFSRKRVIADVEQGVIRKLCKIFTCTENVLPRYLEERFDVDLTSHGIYVDKTYKDTVAYLNEEQAARYKLTFRAGLAYALDRTILDMREVKADTSDNATLPSKPKHRLWCYGYVFTNKGLFMAEHDQETSVLSKSSGKGAMDFFHSSYMAGKTVVCAGDISFKDGCLTSISNFSGHYQPESRMLLPVLRYLQSKHVQLDDVRVILHSDIDDANNSIPRTRNSIGLEIQDYEALDADDWLSLSFASPDNVFRPHPRAEEAARLLPIRRATDFLNQGASTFMPNPLQGMNL